MFEHIKKNRTMLKSNYDKFPFTETKGEIFIGWDRIREALMSAASGRKVICIDLYVGTYEEEISSALKGLGGRKLIDMRSLMKSEEEISRMTEGILTDDVLFGHRTYLSLEAYFPEGEILRKRAEIASSEDQWLIIGSGAALLSDETSLIVYADMARWELQQRFRRGEVKALGLDNSHEGVSLQYKRGYFNDWIICDRHKESLLSRADFWLDTNCRDTPKLISRETFLSALEKTSRGPFRVVPFFDPAPWGGQWMKEVCDLDRNRQNFGWCFDCVPEENSLLLKVDGTLFELPSQDLILLRSRDILGGPVEARFGKDFPIRFDFLDTMGGGNLSLQVHPTTQFAKENFGLNYTQDESYYLLDAGPDACVYLGLKSGIDPHEMIHSLRVAHEGGAPFDAEKYVNKLPAHKHDHYLIPGGTVHCSGSNSMVLEISSTPNLFTFKLWDWNRLGLDGKPRPINIERGKEVIDWSRDTDYVKKNLSNHIQTLSEEASFCEQRTGLHPNEFIETRRHWFTGRVTHNTGGSVNVLNLVEGREAIVESPEGKFPPLVVHYAETFIIPASVGTYTIRPYGESEGQQCGTIKAYVRF